MIITRTSPEIVHKVSSDKEMMNWIVKQNEKTVMMMSVCTGGLILANTSLLDGPSATTCLRMCMYLIYIEHQNCWS